MSLTSKKFLADSVLEEFLQKRLANNSLRQLSISNGLIDFCSNDYLGFARSSYLKKKIDSFKIAKTISLNGSGGSRLLSGNSELAENLEKEIAAFHKTEAGLIYNSGYDANVGLLSCITTKGDTLIYDEYVHASIHDGILLSKGSAYMFRHNDLTHLEERLKIAAGTSFVIIESVYSMDGDTAPLKKIAGLCKKYNASLIVDEAHATGIIGKGGAGLVNSLKLEKEIFARVHTFGKALGCHGAIVLGSKLLINYLINFSRPFIYTTALPPHSLVAIKESYELLKKNPLVITKLNTLVKLFKSSAKQYNNLLFIESSGPIQSVLVPGNERVKKLARLIQQQGFDVRAVVSPTVPKGKERIRICLHTFNTYTEIKKLIHLIAVNLSSL